MKTDEQTYLPVQCVASNPYADVLLRALNFIDEAVGHLSNDELDFGKRDELVDRGLDILEDAREVDDEWV